MNADTCSRKPLEKAARESRSSANVIIHLYLFRFSINREDRSRSLRRVTTKSDYKSYTTKSSLLQTCLID